MMLVNGFTYFDSYKTISDSCIISYKMPGSNNSKRTHLYSIRSTINIITQGYGIIGKAMGNFFRNTNKVCHIIFLCV